MTGSPSFVAIDFETANAHRGSVCAIGLTKVSHGKIVKTTSWLINPHESVSDFHPLNIRIHGITPAMVQESGIGWLESQQKTLEFIEDLPVIAHNSGFDRSVWNHANQLHQIPELAPDFYCTLSLARRLSRAGQLEGPQNHRLDTLSTFFDIAQEHHHEAGEDSLVAAHLALKLMNLAEGSSVASVWGSPTSSGPISNNKVTLPRKVRRNNLPSVVEAAAPPESIAGECFTLTGGVGFDDT